MGYISIDRKIMEWEWYKNQNVKNLFFHCLLKANYTDKPWQGQIIHRGQFVTSLDNLATQTGLSVSKVRTALKKLNKTKELTSEGTPRNTIITINNYDKYQDNDKQIDKQMTNKSQTNDKQIATTNKDNKDNKDKNIFIAKSFFQKLIAEDSEVKKFPELHQIFFEWLQYKTDIKKQYKTERSVRGAFFDLVSLSKSDSTSPKLEISARDHVDYAIAKGWQGLYSMPKPAKLALQQERGEDDTTNFLKALRELD